MSKISDLINNQIENLAEGFKNNTVTFSAFIKQGQDLTSQLWWAEQWDKLENAKTTTIDAFNRAGNWTKEQLETAYTAIKNWFDVMGQKMSEAWGSFKESVGQNWGNFKHAMIEFGEKIAEMWNKAMDSLGKLWDEIKIGAHDVAIDVKTGVLNLCTDMKYGVANLGIEMQKAGLAIDDAYQQVKGTISGKIADKYNESAGKLLVEFHDVTEKILDKTAKLEEFSVTYFEDVSEKTVAAAEQHQENVIAKLQEQQKGLESKMESRESVRDYMESVLDGVVDKQLANLNKKDTLSNEAVLNTEGKKNIKENRTTNATDEKRSYANKVRESRSAEPQEKGGRV